MTHRDPASLREPYSYRQRTARHRGFRFGVIEGACDGAQLEVQRNFERSLEVLQQIGSLEHVELPDFPYAAVASTVIAAEAYAAFDDFIAAGRTVELTAPKAHGHRLAAAVLPAHDYIRAQRIRRILGASFTDLASRYDALLAPSLGVVASGVLDDFEYRAAPCLGAASFEPSGCADRIADGVDPQRLRRGGPADGYPVRRRAVRGKHHSRRGRRIGATDGVVVASSARSCR